MNRDTATGPVLPHRGVAAEMAAELGRRDDVEAVLLGGSVARGDHLASSDLDLLVVGPEADELAVRVVVDGLLVERISHSETGWARRFDRPRTSWLYAFRESVPLVDRGAGQRLRELAEVVRGSYRASEALRTTLATTLWHGRAKLSRALAGGSRDQGYWASVVAETMIDSLYTVHDIPLPAGSRRLEQLVEVPLTPNEAADLAELLTGTPGARIAAANRLAERLAPQLGPPDHALRVESVITAGAQDRLDDLGERGTGVDR